MVRFCQLFIHLGPLVPSEVVQAVSWEAFELEIKSIALNIVWYTQYLLYRREKPLNGTSLC